MDLLPKTEAELQKMLKQSYDEGFIKGLAESVAEKYKNDTSALYRMLQKLRLLISTYEALRI